MQNTKNLSSELKSTPFITRFIYITLITTQIINWMTNGWISINLSSSQQNIIQNYQIWRIITSWIYQPSSLVLLIMLINLWSFLPKYQHKNSSAVALNDIFINFFFFSGFFLLIQFAFSFIFGNYLNLTFSFVFTWINMMYKYCYFNSEQQIKICFIDKKINIKVYPFIIVKIICVCNMGIRWDAVLAILAAVVQCRYFHGGMILFDKDSYIDKQKAANFFGLAQTQCWQNLIEDKIDKNHRWTVSSSQFYIGLYQYQNDIKISQDQSIQNTSSQSFPGIGVRIGQ